MHQIHGNVLETISREYYNLTASEKKCADYVASHRTETMSITELAEACGVAEATVSRFCRKLGYQSFSMFRLALASSTMDDGVVENPLPGEIREGDSFGEICEKIYSADVGAIRQTLEMVDREKIVRAADLLERSEKVFCMGQGGSMIIAQEAAHLFTMVDSKYFAVTDSHFQALTAVTMDERDTVLFFSYSGATLDMMQTLAFAREHGARIILITHFPNSPGAAFADVVLQCGANESPLQLGSVAARVSQLFLLDILFTEICLRDLPRCRKVRQMIADALAEKHM